jgi:hypothetical protein
MVSGLYAGFSAYQARSAGASGVRGGGGVSAAASVGHATLDPALFEGPVREAYKVARAKPELLAQLHCYCGCDKVEGHRNLLDCFRDSHGSRCEICVGEALQANHMAEQGATVEQIRDAVRARYYHEG